MKCSRHWSQEECDREEQRVDFCMKTEEMLTPSNSASLSRTCFNSGNFKPEHKCSCFYGKAVAITYSRVNERHLEVPFILLF